MGRIRGRTRVPSAPFLKGGKQKCASDASAVSVDHPTPRVLLDG